MNVVHVFFLKILGIQLWDHEQGIGGSSSVLWDTESPTPRPTPGTRSPGPPSPPLLYPEVSTPINPFPPSQRTQDSASRSPLLSMTGNLGLQQPPLCEPGGQDPSSQFPQTRGPGRCTCSFSGPTMPPQLPQPAATEVPTFAPPALVPDPPGTNRLRHFPAQPRAGRSLGGGESRRRRAGGGAGAGQVCRTETGRATCTRREADWDPEAEGKRPERGTETKEKGQRPRTRGTETQRGTEIQREGTGTAGETHKGG